jgi:hypothetical protein
MRLSALRALAEERRARARQLAPVRAGACVGADDSFVFNDLLEFSRVQLRATPR